VGERDVIRAAHDGGRLRCVITSRGLGRAALSIPSATARARDGESRDEHDENGRNPD
jgi:hypothetical protein